MGLRQEQRTPDVFEPILEKKDCKVRIDGADNHDWTPKEATGVTEKTKGMKIQMTITDPEAICENKDAKPRARIEDYINLAPHPYVNKDGEKAMLRPNKVYQLQRALGFDPLFVDDGGNPVEPKITRNGNKVCPVGAHERLNPEFVDAYFDQEDNPRFDAWIGREITVHVVVEKNEEYGASNRVKSYRPKQD